MNEDNRLDRASDEKTQKENPKIHQILVDSMPCVAFLLRTGTYEIVASNAAAAEKGAIPGKKCHETWAQRDEVCSYCLAPELWKDGKEKSLKIELNAVQYDTHWIPITDDIYMHYAIDISERERCEERLRESEEKYRAVFEQAADAIVLIDPETGRLIEFNDRANEFLGYTREEFSRAKLADFKVNKITGEVSKHMKAILLKGEDSFETTLRTKSGDVRNILSTVKVVTVRGDSYIHGIWRDITEQKSAEKALRESEEQYRDFVEGTNNLVTRVDHKGRFLFVNKMSEEVFGLTPEECVDLSAFDFIHPEDREDTLNSFHAYISNRVPTATFENRQISRSHEVRHMIWTATFLYDEADNLICANGIARDMTDRIKSEAALRESEQRFRSLSASSPVGIFQTDIKGKGIYFNQMFRCFSGLPIQEHYDDGWAKAIHPDDRDRVWREWRRMVKGEGNFTTEFRFVSQKNGLTWVASHAVHLANDLKNKTGIIGTLTDITKIKTAEEVVTRYQHHLEEQVGKRTSQLEAASERLVRSERLAATGQLAVSVAHEINSPLQAISSLLTLMTKRAQDNQQTLEDLDLLTEAFGNIQSTVRHLLDLNRPGKDRIQKVDLNRIIKNSLALLRSHLISNKVKVNLDLSPELPSLHASPQKLGQVILNLVNNSLEAFAETCDNESPPRSKTRTAKREISIRSALKGDKVELVIADNGPGIDKADLERLFDPFFTRKKKMGLGVGLSICSGYVQDHSGTIEAKNAPEGGMIITILLPAKRQKESTHPEESS